MNINKLQNPMFLGVGALKTIKSAYNKVKTINKFAMGILKCISNHIKFNDSKRQILRKMNGTLRNLNKVDDLSIKESQDIEDPFSDKSYYSMKTNILRKASSVDSYKQIRSIVDDLKTLSKKCQKDVNNTGGVNFNKEVDTLMNIFSRFLK